MAFRKEFLIETPKSKNLDRLYAGILQLLKFTTKWFEKCSTINPL